MELASSALHIAKIVVVSWYVHNAINIIIFSMGAASLALLIA
jgi:hypothetical protein